MNGESVEARGVSRDRAEADEAVGPDQHGATPRHPGAGLAALLLEAAERNGSVDAVRRQAMLALLLDGKLDTRPRPAASAAR